MVPMMARLWIVLSCLLVVFVGGCSGGSQSPKCISGASAECYCPTGQQGAQTCTSAGTFAACVCTTPKVDAGGGAGSDGAISLPDAPAVGGSGGSAGMGGGGGGPVVDAVPDQSADVPVTADAFPDAALDTGEDDSTSGTTPAIISFTASPATISAGQSSMLSWTVTGATMLTLDQGAGSALVTVLGANSQTVTPTQTTTYTLTLNGSISAQVTVTVVPLPVITSFSASPSVGDAGGAGLTVVNSGGSVTLTAVFSGGTGTVDQGIGAVTSGVGTSTVPASESTTYTLTVTNAVGGSTTAQLTVVVSLPSITSFTASPNPVSSGGSVTLTAVFSGGTGTVDQGIGAVTSGVGTSTGPISADTTYTLTVTNAVGGSTTAWVTVMLPTTNLAVWVAQKTAGGPGQIALSLRIDNETSQTVDMSTVTLRYWYQDEGLGTNLVLSANYVSIGYSNQGKVTSGIAVANP